MRKEGQEKKPLARTGPTLKLQVRPELSEGLDLVPRWTDRDPWERMEVGED
jgi:hypothetical protein